MNNLNFKLTDKIVLVRSAHIGDFLVCIPLIERLLTEKNIETEKVFFIIINNNNSNPVTMIFGENFFPSENVFVVSNSPGKMLKDALLIRKKIGNVIDYVCYLPFYTESVATILKKTVFMKLIFGAFKKIHGTYFKDHVTSNSQYISLLNRFGFELDRQVDYINFLRIDSNDIRTKVERLLVPGERLKIALYPNSKLAMKIWPLKNYVDLIRELLSLYDPVIYLVGAKEDRGYNQTLMDGIDSSQMFNLAGELSIRESMLFLTKMDIMIGNDGAPLHMAALAKTPIVGLYTYKAPVGMWDPMLTDSMITLRKDVECRECYKEECADPHCLTYISVENVLCEVKRSLEARHSHIIDAKTL